MTTKKGYWYLTTTFYCPVCLREHRTRERQYSTRPENWNDRNRWVQSYDWCEL